MQALIRRDIRQRCRRPRVFVPLALAIAGSIIFAVLGLTDRSSGGAGMWVPFVITPGITGALWMFAGGAWILLGQSRGHGVRCAKCGYDLRAVASDGTCCPECGSTEAPTSQHPPLVMIITSAPGGAAVIVGALMLGSAAMCCIAIRSGVFDV